MDNLINRLYKDGSFLLNIGIASKLAGNESTYTIKEYSEISGSFENGCQDWCYHNVFDIEEKENNKYYGWVITLNDSYGNAEEKSHKLYIEKSQLKYAMTKTKNWKHCRNSLIKFFKIKH
tara:strand:- start:66 stop:425 length:360 start_codon:yes stop_codon:yes gene_type:complete